MNSTACSHFLVTRTGEVFAGGIGAGSGLIKPVHYPDFRKEVWTWDVFVCHAGEDKPFARFLRKRLQELGLRCFVDEDDLHVTDNAPVAMDSAVRRTYIAVILLCKEFFRKEAPQRELRQFLEDNGAFRNQVIPVFLGVSVEECEKLAQKAGLADVVKITGVRHAYERSRFEGRPVHLEETMLRIVREVCHITDKHCPF